MTTTDHLAWRTSTYSGDGENCVEVAPTTDGVVIRHSKHPTAGTIHFPHPAWAAFLHDTREGTTGTNGIATLTPTGTDTLVHSPHTGVELRFDADEWSAFRAGTTAGEFDLPGHLAPATPTNT